MHADAAPGQLIFLEFIKQHRAKMSKGARKASRKRGVNSTWLYPNSIERKYAKYINELMRVYSSRALAVINANLGRWVAETKVDAELKLDTATNARSVIAEIKSHCPDIRVDEFNKQAYEKAQELQQLRQDEFNDEFQRLINELQDIHTDMFTEGGQGTNGFNFATITATIAGVGLAVSAFNKKQEQKFTKPLTGVDNFTMDEASWLPGVLSQWGNLNFNLIKSLSDEYIKKVNTIVSDGILNEQTVTTIKEDLLKMSKNMTTSRAKLIARDQVGKLNGRLTKTRQQSLGIDTYRWLTARDERVRANHKTMDTGTTGKIYRWDDSGKFSTDGGKTWQSKTGNMTSSIPGQDIQCRCVAIPRTEDILQEVDAELDMAA